MNTAFVTGAQTFSLYIKLSWQTLSIAFDESTNTPLTCNVGFASNAL